MIIKILTVFTASLMLYACVNKPNPEYNGTAHALALDEASYAISHALTDLAATTQAATPTKASPPRDPRSYKMGMLASLEWSGPVEPAVREIATAAHFKLSVLGKPPLVPIIVNINEKNQMIGDILRNIAYQCNQEAMVIVFPDRNMIELRYAKR